MATELIRCPQCGAAPGSPPDAFGGYVCRYCHAHFKLKPGQVARPRSQRPAGKAVVGVALFFAGLALVVAALAVVALVLRGRDSPQPAAGKPAATRPASPAGTLGGRLLATPDVNAPKASATFEMHGRKSGYKTSFYVLGTVKNTSPFPIDKPKVVVVLRDQQGKEISTRDGYAERDLLAPGESSPIKVLVSDPPAHDELAFEVSARRALFEPEPVEGLKVEQDGDPRLDFGTWVISGKVQHEGKVPARFVKVEILLRNKAGKLIGIESTYADTERLDPGESARFKASVLLDEKPEKVELSVSARPAA